MFSDYIPVGNQSHSLNPRNLTTFFGKCAHNVNIYGDAINAEKCLSLDTTTWNINTSIYVFFNFKDPTFTELQIIQLPSNNQHH